MNKRKHTISICMGSSCSSRGNLQNLELIRGYLQEKELEAEVEIRGALCKNLCKEGPNVTIDGTLYQGVDAGSLIDLLNNLFGR